MIIPKSKCRLFYNALAEYIERHDNLQPENKEILAVVLDKFTLVISGDATGLMVDQVYDQRVSGNKIVWEDHLYTKEAVKAVPK